MSTELARRGSESPEDLTNFSRTRAGDCTVEERSRGPTFIAKLPAMDIDGIRGRVPMSVRYELYDRPTAPVIRTVIRIYDRPESPLGFETFTNVEQDDQRADFARLGEHLQICLLFYDENHSHRLTKRIDNVEPEDVYNILCTADAIRARIPPERYDFARAKGDIAEYLRERAKNERP